MSAFKQKAVGLLMGGGCATALVCGLGTYLFSFGTVARGGGIGLPGDINMTVIAGMVLTGLGLLAFVGGLGYCLLVVARESRGVRRVVPHARVIARFALSRDGNMHTDPSYIEGIDDPRFYVRLAFGGDAPEEFRCEEQVFWQAGEGMTGEAEVQGRWLGRFTPYRGPGAPPTGPTAYH